MTSSNATHVEFVTLAEAYLDEMMEIELRPIRSPGRADVSEEIRNNRSYFYVMLQDGQLAYYGGFWLVLDEAHITSVTVRDSLRGRGWDGATQHLLEVAEGVGAHIATLEVRESNVRAQNLYKAFGFRQIGRRRGYYPKSGEDAIVMLLELGSAEAPAQARALRRAIKMRAGVVAVNLNGGIPQPREAGVRATRPGGYRGACPMAASARAASNWETTAGSAISPSTTTATRPRAFRCRPARFYRFADRSPGTRADALLQPDCASPCRRGHYPGVHPRERTHVARLVPLFVLR